MRPWFLLALAACGGLEAAGIEHRLVIYEREEHQLALHRPEWLDEVIAWFRAHP